MTNFMVIWRSGDFTLLEEPVTSWRTELKLTLQDVHLNGERFVG